MYPKFIEVHDVDVVDDGRGIIPLSINVQNICGFNSYEGDTDKAVIGMNDGCFHVTEESYDEIKQLIRDAGCIIAKKDPRLDDKPLTMQDLKGMIGEPVWNSNTCCWMLVGEDIGDAVYMVFNAGNGSNWDENMLTHYPLYRMKEK